MKIKKPDNHHFSPDTLVLLVNTGTPDTCDRSGIRNFLKTFLSDRRVIKIPTVAWQFILNVFILPRRPDKLLPHYKSIWKDTLSPIEYHTSRLIDNLNKSKVNKHMLFKHCYLYSFPHLQKVMADIYKEYLPKNIIILPLFPQTSAVTHGAVLDQIYQAMKPIQTLPTLQIINGYYDHPAYISAVSHSIRSYWQENGRSKTLLFSWHGIPQSYFEKGDAYYCFCQKSSRLIAEQLQLNKDEWQCSFQSRFGYQQWLRPYTQEILKDNKDFDICAPGFAIDCLETLYEIKEELGAKRVIPCLNDSSVATDCYLKIVGDYFKE